MGIDCIVINENLTSAQRQVPKSDYSNEEVDSRIDQMIGIYILSFRHRSLIDNYTWNFMYYLFISWKSVDILLEIVAYLIKSWVKILILVDIRNVSPPSVMLRIGIFSF